MRRREVIVAAGVAAFARPALAQAQSDEADVLTRGLRLEHTSVLAYDAVAEAGVLKGAAAERLRTLRAHEAEHAAALTKALRAIRAPVPAPPQDVEVPQIRAGLDGLGDRGDALALLEEVARLSLLAHQAGIVRLRDAGHIQLVATILAAEATHLVAWRTVR